MDLLLATRNQHKTGEIRESLGSDFNVLDLSSFPKIKIAREIGKTFGENAILKAISVSKDRQFRDRLVIADDSGLEVDVLDGEPGIYSARYAAKRATDRQNIVKLLSKLRDRSVPAEKRSARFRCVVALAKGGEIRGTFEGVVEGKIVDPPRGNSGFGYDPIFQPNGFDQTFAEMTPELKNKVSHRGKAIATLREALPNIGN
jgi:XTP/dITP diphosphohydrolase